MPEAEDGMSHKRTGRDVFDALRRQEQGHPGEDKAGEVCSDALPLRLNESTVGRGNHDAVVRAITGDD
jgi:hypothetical protein